MTLDDFLSQAWSLLATRPKGSGGHYITLSTVDAQNAAQSRTVVLRGFDAATQTVDIYTDARSTKLHEIGTNPMVALHLWDAPSTLQLRLTGTADVITGQTLRHQWDALSPAQIEAYSHDPAPGTPITAPADWSETPKFENFAMIRVTVNMLDLVSLAPTGHMRAQFTRATGWSGQWLAP